MKKILIILIIAILTFTSVNTAFAETEDLFYYDYTTNEALMIALEEDKDLMQEFDIEYLERFYLPKGETADINKLAYDLSKMRRYYTWQNEDVLNFMKSEDKAKFLNENMEIAHIVFPCYYDGVLLDDYYEIYTRDEIDYYTESDLPPSKKIVYKTSSLRCPTSEHYFGINFMDKQQLINSLEEDGFGDYTVIHPVDFCDMYFTIAEKDGETFAIFMKETLENFFDGDTRKQVYDNNIEQFKNRVFTISQMEKISKEYEDIQSKIPKSENGAIVWGKTSQNNKSFPWEWVILGSIVLVVIISSSVLLVIKKKKIK